MGQNSTFYEIIESDFNKIKHDISLFNLNEAVSFESLENSALGIAFVLRKYLSCCTIKLLNTYLNQRKYWEKASILKILILTILTFLNWSKTLSVILK